jgi:competence protein ComEC
VTALVVAGGWMLGVAAGQVVAINLWAALVSACAAGWVAAWRPGAGRLIALGTTAALLGVVRISIADVSEGPPAIDGLPAEMTLVGRVADAPMALGPRTSFPLDLVRVANRDGRAAVEQPVPLRVLVRSGLLPVEYGDLVELHARVSTPRSRPGYPLSDLLARRGIRYVADATRSRLLQPASPSLIGWLYTVRTGFERALRAMLPEPHASLVAGILLGTRSGVPPDLRAALNATGTSHLVAVSGFNVAVVAGLIQLIAVRMFGRPWSLLPMLGGVWAYTLLVGAPPSACRAAIMATLVLVAAAVGRLPDSITCLVVGGALLLAWDPQLLFDVGFQLSMLATAGLVLFTRPISDRLWFLPRSLADALGVVVAVQLVTLPIAIGIFHTFSLVSPLANLLVGFAIPWIMLVGGLLAVLGPLPGIGELLAWLAWVLVSYCLGVIRWAADLPGAVVATGRLSLSVAVVWYGLLLLWAAVGSPDVRSLVGIHLPRRALVIAATVILVPATVAVAAGPRGSTVISLLDVEGPTAFIRAGERTALVGSGQTPSQLAASVAQRLDLWERGVDVAILTRDGPRQRDAMLETLQRYPAQIVIAPSASDLSAAPHVLVGEPGLRTELAPGVTIEVVDARAHEGQMFLDVQILVGDVAIWLADVGPPSSRWKELEQADREVVLRVPSWTAAWERSAFDVPWVTMILDTATQPVKTLEDGAPLLDLRTHGAVDVVDDGVTVRVRTERCPNDRDCLVWSR